MTITKKLGIGYLVFAAISVALVAWLGYHELIQEPREDAAQGLTEIHKNARPAICAVVFFSGIPLLLACAWWWTRRVLAPVRKIAGSLEEQLANNVCEQFAEKYGTEEVDKLIDVFNELIERLDDAFQRVREFTIYASHELKTPLTVMRADIETALADGASVPKAQREWMHEHLDEIQRLANIVDSLTLLAKADAGKIQLAREPVRLEELLHESFEDTQILAQQHDIGVALTRCDPLTVIGDRHRLRQLLLNLTDNAVKYNVPGGLITLALRRCDDFAEIEIANTGEPIAPELQMRVFDRFARGDTAHSRAIEGSGLGLSICRWIAQAHSGTISLSSSPGELTRVTVRLPLAPEAGPIEAAENEIAVLPEI